MGNFFKELFKTNNVSTKDQYGIVLITEDPLNDAGFYAKELEAVMRYPQVAKSYSISIEQAKEFAPELLMDIDKYPAYALIQEGIYRTQSLGHRLQSAFICYTKCTEVILFIEMLEKHLQKTAGK